MTDMLNQVLDPFNLPLKGERLIEASAGTGKTFTLGVLYLRLLLGLGGNAAYLRPLAVDEILVVTFTEAATEELRGRIRDNIHALRLACLRGCSDNPLLQTLMGEIADLSSASALLLAAERQMDDAAIYTIHGFCQRMLTHHAFESGMLFQQALIQDESQLWRQACADFWRRHCYPLSLDVAAVIRELWSGPEALLQELYPYLIGETPVLRHPPAADETFESRHQVLISRIEEVKQAWRSVASDISEIITQSAVDKRSYSSRYLPVWLQTIGEWAMQDTLNYHVPKELERFRQSILSARTNTSKGVAPQHTVFELLDHFLDTPLTQRDLVIDRALKAVRLSVQEEKRQQALMGFDDLLTRLDGALQGPAGASLAQAIRQRYPVAMIDEFQDTDPLQYRIFHTLYAGEEQCALLLIGDPKQAIYAFRGADIFTYMRARSEVSAHYTLSTNWRSAPSLVQGVNHLFQQVDTPFLFTDIPFLPVDSASRNSEHRFILNGETQSALKFWVHPGDGISSSKYKQSMAQQAASEIREWLTAGTQGEALLSQHSGSRAVQAADIAILVRSRSEAELMRNALSERGIPSVYLSNRDSVFTTIEAQELLWLLQAILAPEQQRTLRCALATSLLGLDASQIEALGQNEQYWDQIVEEFASYRTYWLKRGILPMLRQLMTQRALAENILASTDGERRLTDILHLGELLQEAAGNLDSEHSLVRWLAQQINNPNIQSDNQQMRLESDEHVVRIVTIHKSKGLEYPLVWLPFICHFRPTGQALYHDRETLQNTLDLNPDEMSQSWAEQERLSEDLRLLYVALTRSVFHCSIGIAPLQSRKGDTDMHCCALGYLIQRGESGDASLLEQSIERLQADAPPLSFSSVLLTPSEIVRWQPDTPVHPVLMAREFSRKLMNIWRITSYSGLQQYGPRTQWQELVPRLDVDATSSSSNVSQNAAELEQPLMSAHRFPRGAAAGTFLHALFETLDFSQPLAEEWPQEALIQQGIDGEWQPILHQWIQTILRTPLLGENADESGIQSEIMTLSALAPTQKQAELQFYLPVKGILHADVLDKLTKRYDPLSAQAPALSFQQVTGMLKGFIDLIFCWQGKYYLLDYKSNWLGDDVSAYTQAAMAKAMIEHRYDLQYQLYTLALHRYLRHRLPSYDYQTHFGGVIYLFLRGMEQPDVENGIFRCRPDYALIEQMDSLFQGKDTEESVC